MTKSPTSESRACMVPIRLGRACCPCDPDVCFHRSRCRLRGLAWWDIHRRNSDRRQGQPQQTRYCILGIDVKFRAELGGTFTGASQQTKGYINKYALAGVLFLGILDASGQASGKSASSDTSSGSSRGIRCKLRGWPYQRIRRSNTYDMPIKQHTTSHSGPPLQHEDPVA